MLVIRAKSDYQHLQQAYKPSSLASRVLSPGQPMTAERAPELSPYYQAQAHPSCTMIGKEIRHSDHLGGYAG